MKTQDLFNSYRERSTAKLQWECDSGIITLPEIKSGYSTITFKKGDKVRMNESSAPMRDIGVFTVKETYYQNNWQYIILEEKTGFYSFREKDLIKVK